MEHLIGRESVSVSHTREQATVHFPVTALHFVLLTAAVLIFVYVSVPQGKLFGSETDWYCQHITIVDTMRKQFYATGNLFPDWTALGSGANFYTLSYYGFLRPDVLICYLLPSVPVETVIQFYAVTEMAAGACLLYWWLLRHGMDRSYCLTGGFLYLTANCMFQAHRQIMFVNYLPFLILALLCTDSIKTRPFRTAKKYFPLHPGLAVCFFMISVHSFYFLPSCLVCCTLYFLCTGKKEPHMWKIYIMSTFTGLCLAMVHLLPTALVILENKKDAKPAALWQIFTVNPSMNTLLYSPYGCGLTLLVLYCMVLSLGCRKTKKLAFALLILCSSQLCCWILNGTLYLRPKALIPFLPLFLLLTAHTLSLLQSKKLRHSFPLAVLCTLPALVQVFFFHSSQKNLILADVLVLLFYSLSPKAVILSEKNLFFSRKINTLKTAVPFRTLQSFFTKNSTSYVLLCVIPALLFLSTAKTENFADSFRKSRETFTSQELNDICTEPGSAIDIFTAPMTNSNYMLPENHRRTTMYSSVSNTTYNHLFYDILKMPVSARNRVSMNAAPNPFQEYLTGVRYIQTSEDRIPAGYITRLKKENLVLAENPGVLPVAYGTSALMSEADYDRLVYPYNLDSLTNRTIVPETVVSRKSAYTSQMKEYPLPQDFMSRSSGSQAETVSRSLPSVLKDQVLLPSFDVDYNGSRDVDITINGIRNRLSGSSAPYPNHNHTFTYMLSANTPLKTLEIAFSKGNYKIKNLRGFTLPVSAINHPDIIPFTSCPENRKALLQGNITMKEDGYFVTSFAYSRGYQIRVDGHRAEPVMVNKGFVGFPIKKGTHEVLVTFHAPGKRIGILFSCAAAVLLLAKLSTSLLSSALRFPQDSHNNPCGVRPL